MNAPLKNPLVALTIPMPSEDVTRQANELLESARAIVIDSSSMLEIASDELAAVKRRGRELEEARTKLKAPVLESGRVIDGFFKPAIDFCVEAERVIKGAILKYQDQQEAIRRAEQARLEAAAAAERKRLDDEYRAANEAAAKAAAEASAALRVGDMKAMSEALAKQQDAAASAESSLALSEIVTAPVVQSTSQVRGISTRGAWKGRCVDKLALINYIATHQEFANLLIVDQTALNACAKAMKGSMKIDGCEPYEDRTLSQRAA